MTVRSHSPESKRDLRRIGGMIILGALLVCAFSWHINLYHFLCDDAFISFRYARNLVEGNGLVFNDSERVEGYTNFLWVIELAGIWKALGVPAHRSANLLSLFYTAATAILILALTRSLGRRHRVGWAGLVALLLWGCNRNVAVWSTGGLETRQFTFMVCLAVLAVWQGRKRRWLVLASCALAAAELTRPEGLMLGVLSCAWVFANRNKSLRERAADMVAVGCVFGVVVAGHFIFRWFYYGDLLPNTYYAKHVRPWPEAGFRYMMAAILDSGLYITGPIAVFAATRRWYLNKDSRAIFPFVLMGAHAAYLIRIGGDHFEFRPLDFYWPLLYILCADGIVSIAEIVAGRSPAIRYGRLTEAIVGTLLLFISLVYGTALQIANYAVTHERSSGAGQPRLRFVLDPAEFPMAPRILGLGQSARAFNSMMDYIVSRRIAVHHRQHQLFAEERIRAYSPYEVIAGSGLIPEDAVSGVEAAGIAPYYLIDIEFVDKHGLTDRVVARNPVDRSNEDRQMAHDRNPPKGYLKSRNVNIHILRAVPSREIALQIAPYAVRLSESLWMPFQSNREDWVLQAFAGRDLQIRTSKTTSGRSE